MHPFEPVPYLPYYPEQIKNTRGKMFRKLTIVTFAVLFVALSSASKDARTSNLKRRVKKFELCTNDQAEFYNDIYGPEYGPTDSVKSLFDCEVSFCDRACELSLNDRNITLNAYFHILGGHRRSTYCCSVCDVFQSWHHVERLVL